MRNLFNNKYIVILLSFYAVWILGVPYIFSKTLPQVCENITYNSDYEIDVKKPQLYLNVIPTAKFKAQEINVRLKNTDDYTKIDNFSVSIRLLPLLTGRLHVNDVFADKIVANSVLKKELQLDKDFFKNIRKLKVRCNKIQVNNVAVTIRQPNLANPV